MKNAGELKFFLSDLMESMYMENSGVTKRNGSSRQSDPDEDEFETGYEEDDEDDL